MELELEEKEEGGKNEGEKGQISLPSCFFLYLNIARAETERERERDSERQQRHKESGKRANERQRFSK